MLQILEDGVLTDGQGNKVKFNNTIVILTSNLGSEAMYNDDNFGFHSDKPKTDKKTRDAEYAVQKEAAMRALKKRMRPELINRLDAILVFHPLTEKEVSQIFDTLLEDLKKRLAAKSLGLKITPAVKDWLIKQGYDPKNGARPLRRAIEDHLETLISDAIIKGELDKGDIANVDITKEGKFKMKVGKE